MLERQKRNSEQDFVIIKTHTGPIEKKRQVSQQRFHEHYGQQRQKGMDDWQLTLIEQCGTNEQLK